MQIKTELKPYVARIPHDYELMTDHEIQVWQGGTLIVDTETYPNYFLIAFKEINTQKIIKFEINAITGECFNERKLSWIMHSYTTVGFNTIKYDLALIWLAFARQDNALLKQVSDEIIFQNIWPAILETEHNFKIFKTNHVDLIEVCPLKGSLKLYGARLHAPRIQDLPFDVGKDLTEEQIEIVTDYCVNDLNTTELLMNNLLEQLKLRSDLSQQYNMNLMSKSDAQIAESVIGSELRRITGKWPSKPSDWIKSHKYNPPPFIEFQTKQFKDVLETVRNAEYEVLENGRMVVPKCIDTLSVSMGTSTYRLGNGGLHSSEQENSHVSNSEYQIFDRDVASYYPAIVLNCNLFPKHLKEDFLTVYKTLVERRLAAKKAKQDAIADGLKIAVNGTFGKLGSPHSILYAPDLMIQVTVTGQLALLMLIEELQLADIQVISANTDGVTIYCHRKYVEMYSSVIKYWESKTGFVTEENEYEALYSRDVNAYLAIKKDKSTKGKNIYYNPWSGKAKDAIWRFHKNPSCQICTEAIELLITKEISIEETIRSSKDITKFVAVKNVTGGAHKDGYYLGKVIRWYYAKNIVGTINYIKTGNKVPDSEGAKPLMDLPREFPDDINYEYYIDRTIEMLYDCGYYQREKQMRLFS